MIPKQKSYISAKVKQDSDIRNYDTKKETF